MNLFKSLFLIISFVFSGAALAVDKAAIEKSLRLLIPEKAPDSITESALDGLYEVTYGPRVFYVSADGRYLIQGNLLDVQRMTNLTAERQAELTNAALDRIGEENMVVFPAKNEKHRISVFTDIDCGYCRKLHNEMEQINARGITVQYLFFPRSGVNTPSYYKAQSVWCADDRQQALTDSKNGKTVESKTCDNPIDQHMQLVRDLGLNGTPALVLEDGRVIPGYVPADKLAAMLEGDIPVR